MTINFFQKLFSSKNAILDFEQNEELIDFFNDVQCILFFYYLNTRFFVEVLESITPRRIPDSKLDVNGIFRRSIFENFLYRKLIWKKLIKIKKEKSAKFTE